MGDDAEKFVKLNGRLGAIETLICEALAWQYFQAGISDDQIEQLIELQAEHLSQQAPFQTHDWALSDVASDELRDHVRRLSNTVRARVSALRSSRS